MEIKTNKTYTLPSDTTISISRITDNNREYVSITVEDGEYVSLQLPPAIAEELRDRLNEFLDNF